MNEKASLFAYSHALASVEESSTVAGHW